MKTIAPGVHQVSLGIVNAFLLETPEALVLIDTGFPGSAEKILAAIRALGRKPGELAHIVATHAHPDHIGSLAALVGATGAQTWMHPLDADIVERGQMRPVHPSPGLLPKLLFTLMSMLPRKLEPARIDHRIEDGAVLPFGGLRAILAPGHSAGQIALLWPDRRLLLAADTCMNLIRLRPPQVNENAALALQTLQRIATLDFDAACFGHGGAIPSGAGARFRAAFAAVPA